MKTNSLLLAIVASLLVGGAAHSSRQRRRKKPGVLLIDGDDAAGAFPWSKVHSRVVEEAKGPGGASDEACVERAEELRRLIAEERYDDAIALSFALEEGVACREDEPLVDVAEYVVASIATPDFDASDDPASARPEERTEIHLKDKRVFHVVAAEGHRAKRTSAKNVPVVGFAIDSTFVLSESTLACKRTNSSSLLCDGAGRRGVPVKDAEAAASIAESLLLSSRKKTRTSRVVAPEGDQQVEEEGTEVLDLWNDGWAEEDLYAPLLSGGGELSPSATGTRTVLVMIVCPKLTNGATTDCSRVYDYNSEVVAQGGIENYMRDVAVNVGEPWLDHNSYGQLDLVTTLTPVLVADYDNAQCGNMDSLSWRFSDPGAMNSLARFAALDEGFDPDDFDYYGVIIPQCNGLGWAGLGFVAGPGFVVNLGSSRYDYLVYLHEFGHNIGATHASCITDGERGAVAYVPSNADWVEYCNPYSIMGAGGPLDGVGFGEFLSSNKELFGWLTALEVDAYDFARSGDPAQCASGCGPYLLQPVDVGTLDQSGGYAAIKVPCEASDVYLHLELRTLTTSPPAVLMTWTEFFRSSTDNTVIVDTTPLTTSSPTSLGSYSLRLGFDDGVLRDGGFTFYLDDGPQENYPLTVVAETATNGDVSVTLYTTDVPTAAPFSPTNYPTLTPSGDCPVLALIPRAECPDNPDLPRCNEDRGVGALCEGDGECGTDNGANNCDGGWDLYRVVAVRPGDGPTPAPATPAAPTAYPTLPQTENCPVLALVPTGECPANPDIGRCNVPTLVVGDICEGDGECGTDNGANNCDPFEIYKVIAAAPTAAPTMPSAATTPSPSTATTPSPSTATPSTSSPSTAAPSTAMTPAPTTTVPVVTTPYPTLTQIENCPVLALVPSEECPANPRIGQCNVPTLVVGDLCEGDGECGTDRQANNCDPFEIYKVIAAAPTATPTTASPSTAAPTTASPSTAPPTTASPTTPSPSTAAPSTAKPSTATTPTSPPAACVDGEWAQFINGNIRRNRDCTWIAQQIGFGGIEDQRFWCGLNPEAVDIDGRKPKDVCGCVCAGSGLATWPPTATAAPTEVCDKDDPDWIRFQDTVREGQDCAWFLSKARTSWTDITTFRRCSNYVDVDGTPAKEACPCACDRFFAPTSEPTPFPQLLA